MSRLVPAATQLLSELDDRGKPYKVEQGDPDGLGFVREIKVDARTSKWLVPVLDAIGDDRIHYVDYQGKGKATIVFVADTRADFPTSFDLLVVDAVLNDDAVLTDEES